ncbi:hypothetical protein [Nonomuraea sp. NPDC049784]|uniref:hypothetical protein n=1 Tax=Nonomuraea sp. NPDC049784 TaxID=3154361 RepID=UPI0033CA7F66
MKDAASASALGKQDPPLADPDQVQTLGQLAQALSLLLAGSGLSMRQVANRTRHDPVRVARETCGKMLRGERLASKAVTLALVTHLGVQAPDLDAWERAWQRAFLDEGGVRTAPPRGQMAELRELVTALQERLEAQEKELAALRGAISSAAASPPPAQDGSTRRSSAGGHASIKAIALEMDVHDQMRAAVPEVARETVAEITQRVRRRDMALEFEVKDQLRAQVPQVSKEIIRALAEQVARRDPLLEVDLLDHMRAAAADAGRDVVTEMARRLT